MNFDQAFDRLIGHEGGYANHPNDPGGETMWGITQRVARANGYTGAMRDLPRSEAKRIARASYWNPVSADALPPEIRFDVFDGAYNSGVRQSIRWLQRTLGVVDDGIIGPKTLMAVKAYNPWQILCYYNGHRLFMLTDLSGWEDFGRGWSRRIADNLRAKLPGGQP